MTELRVQGSTEPVEPFALSPEQEAEVERQLAAADHETDELRVTLRWGRAQLAVVRRAAARYGLPYQTYIKEAAFRQALADLEKVAAAGV
jgi:predicted DNA binding CopG/RHH family protein